MRLNTSRTGLLVAAIGIGAVLGCTSNNGTTGGGSGSGGTAAAGGAGAGGAGGSGAGGKGGSTGGAGGTPGTAGSNAGGAGGAVGGSIGSARGGTGGASGGSGGASSGSGGASGGSGGASGGSGGPGGGSGGAGSCTAGSLASTTFAVRFADEVMTLWPDPGNIHTPNAWEYNHGIVLRGMQQVWQHTCDARYLAYVQKYADEWVNASGVVNIPAAHSFDNIQPSVLLPWLYQQTSMAKYHTAADNIFARYATIPVNANGGFWHKSTYPYQMWLDSIYMGEPFLDQYAVVFGCPTCAATIFKQVLLIEAHTRASTAGLYVHAWDDSYDNTPPTALAAWADPTTGESPVVWDRLLGWYAMALVDMLPDLPAGADAASMLSILTGIAAALKATQDPTTGLWYEVVDEGSQSDDWVETSGSGMFVYFLKRAVGLGYIDSSYLAVASKGWTGMQTKITTDSSGTPTITDTVVGLSVLASYADYINQATASNSPHGLCAVMLAASEMEAQ